MSKYGTWHTRNLLLQLFTNFTFSNRLNKLRHGGKSTILLPVRRPDPSRTVPKYRQLTHCAKIDHVKQRGTQLHQLLATLIGQLNILHGIGSADFYANFS